MKNILNISVLLFCVSCNTNEDILFEFKDLDDVLYMAESTNIAEIPEDDLVNYLLGYEQIKFEVNDTNAIDYGRLRYCENSSTIFKHIDEIYSNDKFSVHVILREITDGDRNYKFFIRTINKSNFVIDSYELASWIFDKDRYCYGTINDKLEIKLICDNDVESSYIDENGYFRNTEHKRASKNQLVDYYEYLSTKLSLQPIEKVNYEVIRVTFYSSFQYGKVIEFSNNDSEFKVSSICYTETQYSYPCEEFESNLSLREWQELNEILNEFDFQTEEQVRNNEDVLDGFIYIVEGRIKNDKSSKLQYRILSRGSPFFDKIGSLCESLIKFGENKREIK